MLYAMTDVVASVFVDVYQSHAQLTLFDDGNCFLITSTVRGFSFQQMSLMVAMDGSAWSILTALYDHGSLRFDILLHGIFAKTNPNMR